jgi:hypothetical protein
VHKYEHTDEVYEGLNNDVLLKYKNIINEFISIEIVENSVLITSSKHRDKGVFDSLSRFIFGSCLCLKKEDVTQ